MKTEGYEVTEDGIVYSRSSNWRGYGKRPMVQFLDQDGYKYVRLTINGIRKRYRVHRLVIQTYKGNSPKQVRHIDGNKLNNRISNLTYGSAKENADDRELHGRTAKGQRNGFSKLTDSDVINIRKSSRSSKQLAAKYRVCVNSIQKIQNRTSWKHL